MNFELSTNNRVYLCGKIVCEPVFSHEIYGEGFYDINLEVPRLSEQCDIIPITVSERLFAEKNMAIGTQIAVKGQFRSYNKLDGEKSRLLLTAFVRDVVDESEIENPNQIDICGYICKQPVYRTTPFKREICDVLLAVNRAYNKSDYIPCILWGRNARFVQTLPIGSNISVSGRIQSRKYVKNLGDDKVEERVAYEVSVSKVTLERDEHSSKTALN